MSTLQSIDLVNLVDDIKAWAVALGFQQVGISDIDLSQHEYYLQQWLNNNYHGEMDYMASHGMKRARPDELVPGTLRVISVRMDYLPPDASFAKHLKDGHTGYISRYALGRDYHKVLRKKLKQLGEQISQHLATTAYRPFVDSAPVLEHAIAEKAGIGWTGKHTLTLNKQAGSWFFLGELFINLPLPVDEPAQENCGTCNACITMCPTQAIVAPYQVDARRCISYLTIEYNGIIPESLRPAMGNRIYGCDDCQLVCPWNRYAPLTSESDFHARGVLHGQSLLTLFRWDEDTFLRHTEGSPIRRIGFAKWRRNLCVAIGNAPFATDYLTALDEAEETACELVRPHLLWARQQQISKQHAALTTNRQVARLTRSIEKGLPRDA
ncbi:tRNA epoxyqueuosine(34) reductase QueG [Alteromonas lipolytica]|uniref:Epoxyqueuosine reductase n=1 Tax=Alteromonas lipolytica TaxID=1856405 RepID=A0A1E8F9A2_9ALTE|nr:tRNA epoxyqueuosine(34) reductase QueG [Alteromonas lipolytica]OFI32123.1 tRNA epoxyqueuosine(34) reductase QueG [Alteromonas lipolytica]GGF83717.1 epoxyqueuosine reductase [Alteromonas lipolytica]